MDEEICRVCLETGVKMYDLKAHPLEMYFEPLIYTNPLSVFELPNTVCYQCASMIKKFYLFREQCIKGQSTLYKILDNCGKLGPMLSEINRESLNLFPQLSFHKTPEPITLNHDLDTEKNNEETKQINQITLEDILIKSEELSDNDDRKSEMDPGTMEFPFDLPMGSSDDEPLSVHKIRKKKKVGSVKKKKKDSGERVKKEKSLDKPKIKKEEKRGRPKKESSIKITSKRRQYDEYDNVEDYCNVIKLTYEEQLEEMEKRKTSLNYLNSLFKCDLCYKGFTNTVTWQHHMTRHSEQAGDVECNICKFLFKNTRTLRKHIVNHQTKYECKACSVVSKTRPQAKQHQRWHKGVTYTCPHCDDEFSKWTSYLSHVRIKHPSQFICSICGYSFVSDYGLSLHKSMMHKHDVQDTSDIKPEPPAAGKYCAECDLHFANGDAYRRHLVTSTRHASEHTFSTGCKECGQSFPDHEQLRLHHRKEHARKHPVNLGKKRLSNDWPSKCVHCDEMIPNARSYWAHFRRVHPDRQYPIDKSHICEICGKGFKGNAFLKYHKRTHFSERAYKCPQCPKAFFNRTNLQMHEKSHSDSRPHPCELCFKAFKNKSALDRHFRSHTGAKPYQCEVCGKAFNQSNSRKLHVRTVHLKQPAPYVSKSRMERRKGLQAKLEPEPYVVALVEQRRF